MIESKKKKLINTNITFAVFTFIKIRVYNVKTKLNKYKSI